jgi:bacteriorhodopsin
MDIQIESVLMFGIAFFALASTYFLWAYRKEFNSAFLVSFITLISYVLMFEGSLATVGAGGGEVHASRWLFYGLSCTLLVYEIAKFLGKSMKEIVFMLYLTVIVMATGAASAIYDGGFMLGMFAISSVAYVLLMYPLLTADSPHRGAVAKYILLGWTGFPVAFILAPDGFGLIGAAAAAMLYLLFDVFTKVVFYLDLHKKMQAERIN